MFLTPQNPQQSIQCYLKIQHGGQGWRDPLVLKAMTFLAEDQNLILSTNMVAHNPL